MGRNRASPSSIAFSILAALLLEAFAVIFLLSASASPSWGVVIASVTYDATKDNGKDSYSAENTVAPGRVAIGLTQACGTNITTSKKEDGGVATYRMTGYEEICTSGDQNIVDAFFEDPFDDETPNFTFKEDSMRSGALTLIFAGVVCGIACLVLRIFFLLNMCSTCPSFLKPESLTAILAALGAACAFGSMTMTQLSPYVWVGTSAWNANSAIAGRCTNIVSTDLRGMVYGSGAYSAFVAGIALSTTAIDSVWGLWAPIEGHGKKRSSSAGKGGAYEGEESTSNPLP